jgi:glycosyltransferase involved in cell wall biosynthesis
VNALAGTRIVFVLAGEVLGGAESNAINLAARLAQVHGADVSVCALDDRPGRARQAAASAGIRWEAVRTPWRGGRIARSASLLRVAHELRKLRPDVLVAATNLPNVACGLTWRLTGAKTFVWTQCDVLGTQRFSRRLFRRALQEAPVVVTTAQHARDWLVNEWSAAPERVRVIRSEVRLPAAERDRAAWREQLDLDPADVAACMVAHLHPGKDHPTLLRAWRTVADRTGAKLVLAGRPAGAADDVKALAFDLDLRDDIRFAGEVDDIAGLLGAVDLGVFASRSECLGRGATEPMYAGLAVAGTDVPGIREAVGETGRAFLAPPGDHEALASAVLQLVQDEALRARVGRANAELIRARQSPEATSDVFAELVSTTLS